MSGRRARLWAVLMRELPEFVVESLVYGGVLAGSCLVVRVLADMGVL